MMSFILESFFMQASSILITGASSGIGRALALACAARGVELHLSGRDEARLQAVANDCHARSAKAYPRTIDVTDSAAMAQWIAGIGQLDWVFANAGISAGTHSGGDGGVRERAAQVRVIFATNLNGVLNTILPAIERMESQPPDTHGVRGRIVNIASMAAFIAFPGAPTYCASKAAVDYWTTASAPSHRQRGIVLHSVCPGFVRSAMTAANDFPMPGLIDAERAAAIILRSVRAGKRRIVFPWWMAIGARFMQLLPPALSARMLASQRSMGPLPELADRREVSRA